MTSPRILNLALLGLALGGCRLEPEIIEPDEGIPVVCIKGKAEAFYIANGPHFSNIGDLVAYLRRNHDRIVVSETDTAVPFAEKLVKIFADNGIAIEKYIYLYPPPEPAGEAGEVLTFAP